MTCPRCNGQATDEMLREFGGVCPKCLLDFAEEKDAPAFPNLEILEMIGQGGMGVVYKARQKNLNRVVALKVLSPQFSADPDFVTRFTREAQTLAQLSHPNIVAIHDSGVHDRVPYLVMEFVDGTPLRKLLASRKLTAGQALDIVPQICDALQYAHARGVVHRDIKPENILIDREGRVKIADFGLAKLATADETRITKSGMMMGTPHYMAPEQVEHSASVDHRADIYSLGVVFYEMLTGELPLGRFKPPSEKASVDRRLDPVVLKSLEREPGDRWQSASQVKERVTHLPPASSPAGAPVEPTSPLARAAWVILLLGIGALALGLLLLPSNVGQIACLVGSALLLASFVVSIFALIQVGSHRGRMKGGARALGALIVSGLSLSFLLFFGLLWARRAPDPRPEAPWKRERETRRSPTFSSMTTPWSETLSKESEPIGVLAGPYSFLVACKGEIREYDPETGKFLSMWTGELDAPPLIAGDLVIAWGAAKLTLFQSRPNRLAQTHQVVIPLDSKINAVSTLGGTIYASTVAGGVFAVDGDTGKVLWTQDKLSIKAPFLGSPVVTTLDVICFDASSGQVFDRQTGKTKLRIDHAGSPQMAQWNQGWATLTRDQTQICLKTYFKEGLGNWFEMRSGSTADLESCHLVQVGERLMYTTVTWMHGIRKNAPFADDHWTTALPRTTGAPVPFGDEFVAVPTIKGTILVRSVDGTIADLKLSEGDDGPALAAWKSRILVLEPKRRRLTCHRIE